MSVLFRTDYARLGKHSGLPLDSFWNQSVQAASPSRLTTDQDAHGWFMRHTVMDGDLVMGGERCDVLASKLTVTDGDPEIVLAWDVMLEPGFHALNKGWSAVADWHDSRGTINGVGTQAPFELQAAEDGLRFRVTGGTIQSNGFGSFRRDGGPATFTVGVVGRVVLGYRPNSGGTGRTRVAVNGAVVFDVTGSNCFAGGTCYWKQAYYRDPNGTAGTCAVRHYDLSVFTGADTWSEALGAITPPPPPPPPPADSLPLTLTGAPPKVKVAWTPPPLAQGYSFWTNSRRVSSTMDGARSSTSFAAEAGDLLEVRALLAGPHGTITVGDVPPVVIPPSTDMPGFPWSGFRWGQGLGQALLERDVVWAYDGSQGSPNEARKTNPTLKAYMHARVGSDPGHSMSITYGADGNNWKGGSDALSPEPRGAIAAWEQADDGYLQHDGGTEHPEWNKIVGYRLDRLLTGQKVENLLWYGFKLHGGFTNGWDGLVGDNFWWGQLAKETGWAYNGAGPADVQAWDARLRSISQLFRAHRKGFGGNTAYRVGTGDPGNLAFTETAMYENFRGEVPGNPNRFATLLAEARAWQKAGGQYLLVNDDKPDDFGLACATIVRGAYMPSPDADNIAPLPAMFSKGPRHWLGQPVGEASRSGNVWTQMFERGKAVADVGAKTGTLS